MNTWKHIFSWESPVDVTFVKGQLQVFRRLRPYLIDIDEEIVNDEKITSDFPKALNFVRRTLGKELVQNLKLELNDYDVDMSAEALILNVVVSGAKTFVVLAIKRFYKEMLNHILTTEDAEDMVEEEGGLGNVL